MFRIKDTTMKKAITFFVFFMLINTVYSYAQSSNTSMLFYHDFDKDGVLDRTYITSNWDEYKKDQNWVRIYLSSNKNKIYILKLPYESEDISVRHFFSPYFTNFIKKDGKLILYDLSISWTLPETMSLEEQGLVYASPIYFDKTKDDFFIKEFYFDDGIGEKYVYKYAPIIQPIRVNDLGDNGVTKYVINEYYTFKKNSHYTLKVKRPPFLPCMTCKENLKLDTNTNCNILSSKVYDVLAFKKVFVSKAIIHKKINDPSNAYLLKGDEVDILEKKKEWHRIQFHGTKITKGWVKKSDLD